LKPDPKTETVASRVVDGGDNGGKEDETADVNGGRTRTNTFWKNTQTPPPPPKNSSNTGPPPVGMTFKGGAEGKAPHRTTNHGSYMAPKGF